jgi:protein SCO1/2
MVDFIFTTCTTICPVLSAGFSNFQRKMGPGLKDVHLVSISIDPENDSPKKLREYLKRYDAKPGWDFLTGSKADIDKVIKALDAYSITKMSHLPLALLYSSSARQWVRIYGLIGTKDLIAEYEKALKS